MNNLRDGADYQTGAYEPLVQRVWATLKVWSRRHRVRSRLREEIQEMDMARTEKDVGLVTGELLREANKPFWKA